MSSLVTVVSALPTLATLPGDAAPQGTGFNWIGLVVLIVVAAAVFPLYRALSGKLSADRKARWAKEENWEITPENDPDLRHDAAADGPESKPDDPDAGPPRPGGGILR